MSKNSLRISRHASPRIIVGIDPGIAIVGYAFIREQRGNLAFLACDVIRTPSQIPFSERLLSIYKQMKTLLTLYHPAEAAMETLFFGKNRKTAMQVGQARGVLMLALSQYGLPIAEYGPSEVKLALTGYGNARKAQVGEMVCSFLKLPALPKPDDAADAAAIALCHAHLATWRSP